MSRLRVHMGSAGKRALILLLTICVTLIASRAAFAQAPFCDFRAASNVAPPPLLPVRDVRFEQDSAYLLIRFCESLRASTAAQSNDGSPIRHRLAGQDAIASPDAGCPLGSLAFPRRVAAVRVAPTVGRTKESSGFPLGVYRPPR